jgi:hypothetical protein
VAFGLTAGLLAGAMLPLMKYRWLAGIVVGFAMGCGSLIGFRLWNEEFSIPAAAFLGVCMGIIYGVLFWEYQPNDPAPESIPDTTEEVSK